MATIVKKKRKPRSRNNYDLCSCGNAYCDPSHSMHNPYPVMNKIQARLKAGLCMGCGKEPKKCSCKS